MIETVCFYLFISTFILQFIYQILLISVLKEKKSKKTSSIFPAISILIYTKNDAQFLKKNLIEFINLEYPNFEILVINHASVDKTKKIMQPFLNTYQNLKMIDVDNNESFWGNKKYAITLGIKASKFENIVLTKPNCKPVSKLWLQSFANYFSNDKTPVVGCVTYSKSNIFTNYSNIIDTLLMLVFGKMNMPIKAFSENLGFTKKDFFSVKGFVNHIKINNGEDILFINELAQQKKVNYVFETENLIEIEKNNSLKKWFKKKKESLMFLQHLQFSKKLLLFTFSFSRLFFLITCSFLIILTPSNYIFILLSIYLLIWLSIIYTYQKKINQTKNFYLFPFLDIQLLILQCFNFIVYSISKK